MQRGSLGRENTAIRILLSLNQFRQNPCRSHGLGHAPFIKTSGYKKVRCSPTVTSNIGKSIQCDTILICPACHNLPLRKLVCAKCLQWLPTRAFLSCSMASLTDQQGSAVISEGESPLLRRQIHSFCIHSVFHCHHIRPLLVHAQEIPSMLI